MPFLSTQNQTMLNRRQLHRRVMSIGITLFSFLACFPSLLLRAQEDTEENQNRQPAAVSLFGKPLFAQEPPEKLLKQLEQHREAYQADPQNADHLIWYGRFTAYTGDYEGAIEIYTRGIEQFPEDARMLRHRGHRYISTRQFDLAIQDLERATHLIANRENKMEPDGLPNAQNIPVSTQHGNIWYHLGLAYYLKQDFENAQRAYEKCRDTSALPDNLVSATHWLYMIHRRQGNEAAAKQCLEQIELEMEIIENMDYHQCCVFYKGLISQDEFEKFASAGAQKDAVDYAMGTWYLYNNQPEKARSHFETITSRDSWASFGFIAAEADLKKLLESSSSSK